MSTDASLRPLSIDDVRSVLAAFLSAEDMSRQGDIQTLEQAQQYVDGLVDSDGLHHAWAVTDAGTLVGLVAITVDAENLNGWFWYWMNASHRGLGLTRAAATTAANWGLSETGLQRLELGHRLTTRRLRPSPELLVSFRRDVSGRNFWSLGSASTCAPMADCCRTNGQPRRRYR